MADKKEIIECDECKHYEEEGDSKDGFSPLCNKYDENPTLSQEWYDEDSDGRKMKGGVWVVQHITPCDKCQEEDGGER